MDYNIRQISDKYRDCQYYIELVLIISDISGSEIQSVEERMVNSTLIPVVCDDELYTIEGGGGAQEAIAISLIVATVEAGTRAQTGKSVTEHIETAISRTSSRINSIASSARAARNRRRNRRNRRNRRSASHTGVFG